MGSLLLLQTRGDPSTPVAPGGPCTAPSSRQPLNPAGLSGLEEPRGNSGLGSTVQGMAVPLRRARVLSSGRRLLLAGAHVRPRLPSRARLAGKVHIAFQNMKYVPNWRHHCVPPVLVASFKSSAWWKEARVPSCWLPVAMRGAGRGLWRDPLTSCRGVVPIENDVLEVLSVLSPNPLASECKVPPLLGWEEATDLGCGVRGGGSAQSLGVSTQRGLLCWGRTPAPLLLGPAHLSPSRPALAHPVHPGAVGGRKGGEGAGVLYRHSLLLRA